MQTINISTFKPATREGKNSTRFKNTKVGETYPLVEGKDYKLDTDTTDSELPKLNTLRSALSAYAKSRKLKVSIRKGTYPNPENQETTLNGLVYAFYGVVDGTEIKNPLENI